MRKPTAMNLWIIPLTWLIALTIGSIPWPNMIQWWAPEWVVLVLIFWTLMLPYRVGIASAFVLGLLVDVLEGSLLGSHAFAMSVIAYVVQVLYQRLRMYPVFQQVGLVFVLVGMYLTIEHFINNIAGVSSDGFSYLLPAIFSAFFWPLVYFILNGVRSQFRVQ